MADFGVDVIDASLRILVADDVPRWEHRYLVRLFERDKRVQYDQVLFQPTTSGPGENGSPAQLPHDVDGWAKYRLAILGDLTPAELDQESQKALKEYLVDRGGTVILIAGDQAMPQAFARNAVGRYPAGQRGRSTRSVAGIRSGPFRRGAFESVNAACRSARFDGRRLEGNDAAVAHLFACRNSATPKPTARTLINAVSQSGTGKDDKAFLCWQMVGRGRIVYLAAPAVYQLRMKYGDRYHYRFWGQLIRWAVARDLSQGSKTVKLATDRSRAYVGENVQVIANLSDAGGRPVPSAEVRVQASTEGHASSLIELRPDPKIPGRYLGEFSPSEEGSVTLQQRGPTLSQLLAGEGFAKPVATTVMVESSPSVEMQDTRSNVPLLKQIAGLTGGQIVPPAAVGSACRANRPRTGRP